MATKTFKIGEYSKGGVITIEITKNQVNIILKEWDCTTGTRRNSDQKNAKEYNRLELSVNDSDFHRKATMFLHDDTTSYYTDMIMDWIFAKSKINKKLFW